MFSRKIVGAIQILCILGNMGKPKIHVDAVKQHCTLDNNTFRKVICILSKLNYIDRTMSSPTYLTLKISLDNVSVYDIVKACHQDIEIGEIYSLYNESLYNYRFLNEWNELAQTEKRLKDLFVELFKKIKLEELKPTALAYHQSPYL